MNRRYQTGGQALVREINLSTVLHRFLESEPLSRAQLAGVTGLNKTTVSSLVGELIDRGLLQEVGRDTSGSGRPATLLALNPDAGRMIGVALGVDYVSVIVTDFVGEVQWQSRVETDPAQGRDAILAQTTRIVDEARATGAACNSRLLGLGVAIPGTVDVQEGLLIFSPNLRWTQVPLREILHERTGLPVLVDNDANAAAMAEHLFGVARQAEHFVSLFAGVGVGGGLFLNGELYRGAGGFAGEIGHVKFLAGAGHFRQPCRCGSRGCWETSVAQDAIVERLRARMAVGRASLVQQLMADHEVPLTLPLIVQAADAGDAEALEALAETGSLLGLGVASIISIFNPEMIVLGGPLSAAGAYLVPAIREAVDNSVMPEIGEQVQILLSAFGANASVMGAVALVSEAIMSNPSSVERLDRRSHP